MDATRHLQGKLQNSSFGLEQSPYSKRFLWSVNLSAEVTWCNQQCRTFFGLPQRSLLTIDWKGLIHPADFERNRSLWKAAILSGAKYKNRVRLKKPYNQSYYWFEVEAEPLLNDFGEIEGWMGSSSLIKEKAAQENVSAVLLKALAISEHLLVVIIDREYRIQFFNKRAKEKALAVFGSELKKGTDVSSLVIHHDAVLAKRLFSKCWQGEKQEFEHYYDYPTIRDTWFRFSFEPVALHEGNDPYYTIIYGKDITVKKKAEENYRVQAEQLKSTNVDMDLIIQGLSHDLKSPINRTLGLLEVIKMEMPDNNPLLNQYCQYISRNMRSLQLITEDLLNFSKDARTSLTLKPIDWQCFLNQAIEEQHCTEGFEKIHWNVAVEQKHPFYSDLSRLKMIFRNLLSNAIKYRNPHQEKPTVEVEIKTSKNGTKVSISDNGIGISQEHLEKVFDLFYRATSGGQEGTGLGLYIVKTAIDKLNGTIQVGSCQQKGGTCFALQLPNL